MTGGGAGGGAPGYNMADPDPDANWQEDPDRRDITAASPEAVAGSTITPDNEAAYKAYAHDHIVHADNADLLQSWWVGDAQKALRDRCNVSKATETELQAAVKARVSNLRTHKG
jgi:hypothetical protein